MSERPIAILNDCRAPVSAVSTVSFDDLASWFAEPKLGAKDGQAWMPADIEPGPRTAERVRSINCLVLDVEADAEPVKDEHGEPIRAPHGDIIKRVIGAEPPDVDAMVAELALHGLRCCLHTTYSHDGAILPEGVSHPRYRLIFDLSRKLAPAELKPLGLHVAGLLGIDDCIDTGCLEPARLFYAPRYPTEERKRQYRHAVIEGYPLDVDALLADAKRIEAMRKPALAKRPTASASAIDAFNAQADIRQILEQHGYSPKGRRRWLWTGSTTGVPGVRLLPDSTPERVYSSHGGDPLNDGHSHDAFDCWRILNYGGDMSQAVRAVSEELGMRPPPRERTPSDLGKPIRDEDKGEADEPPPPMLHRVDMANMMMTRPPVRWAIEGYLPRGLVTLLGAHGGMGKSNLALVFVAHVACGRDFAGRATPLGKAMYVSLEDDGPMVLTRLRKIVALCRFVWNGPS